MPVSALPQTRKSAEFQARKSLKSGNRPFRVVLLSARSDYNPAVKRRLFDALVMLAIVSCAVAAILRARSLLLTGDTRHAISIMEIVTAIPMALLVYVIVQIRWRYYRGRCIRCGYDFRDGPERCPKCGSRNPSARLSD